MASYEQNKKYAEKYLSKMDEIRIRLSKDSGLKDAIQTHAKAHDGSVQSFIIRAIKETMEHDNKPRCILDGNKPLHVDWNEEEEG